MPHPLDLHHLVHAAEDVTPEMEKDADSVMMTPPGATKARRLVDIVENATLRAYGDAECTKLLHFLSRYPVEPYFYVVSPQLARGERPSVAKLHGLLDNGYGATINLCAEMPDGDDPLIEQAGLSGKLQSHHIPIIDTQIPSDEQLVTFLDLLTDPSWPPSYVHCQAGKCRTGVMTAAYRMAVMGWSASDAVTEARNFGCYVPEQQGFIQQLGTTLEARYAARTDGTDLDQPGPALGRYPLGELRSIATDTELQARPPTSHL